MEQTIDKAKSKQLLHVVFGGELVNLEEVTLKDLEKIDFVGVFPSYDTAYDAWKEAAQRTVDDAHMRYFLVPIYELLDPLHDTE